LGIEGKVVGKGVLGIDECPVTALALPQPLLWQRQSQTRQKSRHAAMSRQRCQIKWRKLEIGKTEISFFGHLLTCHELKIDPNKTKTTKVMPSPTSISELKTVYGDMINYLQRFAPNLAEMTSSLRHRLKRMLYFAGKRRMKMLCRT
jgi:hypothetical protein